MQVNLIVDVLNINHKRNWLNISFSDCSWNQN